MADTHEWAAAWRLTLCGLRRSEIMGLLSESVDLEGERSGWSTSGCCWMGTAQPPMTRSPQPPEGLSRWRIYTWHHALRTAVDLYTSKDHAALVVLHDAEADVVAIQSGAEVVEFGWDIGVWLGVFDHNRELCSSAVFAERNISLSVGTVATGSDRPHGGRRHGGG
jgi:hypothetical protein